MTFSQRLIILLFALLAPLATCAQDTAEDTPEQEEVLFAPADTSSPRATLMSFITAINELDEAISATGYFDRESRYQRSRASRMLDCLDTDDLPGVAQMERAAEIAICLKEIIDRAPLPPLSEIPDSVAIAEGGGQENLPLWRIPGLRVTIVRMDTGTRRLEYLFSRGTVNRAVEYYKDLRTYPYRQSGPATTPGLYNRYISNPGHPAIAAVVNRLPPSARRLVGGVAVWKWMALCGSAIVTILFMGLAYRLQRGVTRRIPPHRRWLHLFVIVFPILAMLAPVFLNHFVSHYLTLRSSALYYVTFITDLVAILASLVVVFSGCARAAETVVASPTINSHSLDAQLIRILFRLLSLVLAVIIFLGGGQYLGIKLTTLLASAGVGGVAVALAAQDTLKTLFGTVVLMIDKPFRVGERIVIEKYDGVVEDIGLRSTRLRLLSGHQATIPNDRLAGNDIENIGRRPHIRRVSDIRIPLDTPREKVHQAASLIRGLLEDHEGMTEEYPPRVFFNDFNDGSFNIRMFYWYAPANYWEFLDFSERLNVEICRCFAEHEIPFTVPKRFSYWNDYREQGRLEVDVGPDAGR